MVDKKIFLLVVVMLLLSVTIVSSLEFDNVKSDITLTKGQTLTIGDKQVAYNDLWETYKPIEIKNAFGLGSTLFKGAITKHTESCSNDCESIITIELKDKGVLIEDIRFKKLVGEKWVDYDFSKYNIYYSNSEESYEEDVYEEQCDKEEVTANGSIIQDCYQVKTGTKLAYKPIWSLINIANELDAGTYQIKITGDKKPNQVLDWQIQTNGEWLEDWAIWNGSSYLLQALQHYWTMDETSGTTAYDKLLRANGVINSGFNINQLCLNGRCFQMASDTSKMTFANVNLSREYSMSFWVYPTAFGGANSGYIWIDTTNTNVQLFEYAGGGASSPRRFMWAYNNTVINTDTTYAVNTWHHIVTTINATKYMKLYVNGVLKNQSQAGSFVGAGTLYLGDQGVIETTLGFYDEIAIWNRTLNQTEVTTLNNSGLPGVVYPFNGILLYGTSNIILNSPANNSVSNNATQIFNCSATPTSPATLMNISLWTNATGTWALNETKTIFETEFTTGSFAGEYITSGIGQDPTSTNEGNAIDSSLSTVATFRTYCSGATCTQALHSNYTINTLNKKTVIINFYADAFGTAGSFGSYIYNFTDSSWETIDIQFNEGATDKNVSYSLDSSLINASGQSIIKFVTYSNGAGTWSYYAYVREIMVTGNKATFTKTLPQNSTKWTCQACDSDGDCAFAGSNYTIIIDSIAPIISITGGNGTNNLGMLNQNHTINFTSTDNNLDKCWYKQANVYNNINDGNWSSETYTGDYYATYIKTTSTNWTIKDDYGTINYVIPASCLTTNFVRLKIDARSTGGGGFGFGDQFLDYQCYNSSNVWNTIATVGGSEVAPQVYEEYYQNNISCSPNINLTITNISNILMLYANDTAGNIANQSVDWNFRVIENNKIFTSQVSEQSAQTFVLNTTLNPSYLENAYASLIYNGTAYSSTKSTSGDNTLFTNVITIPLVTANTNMTFYWIINSTSGDSAVTNTSNQTIVNILIDDCSIYTIKLYNFTIADEQNKSSYPIYNGTLKLDLSLSTIGTANNFLVYNKSYNSTSQKVVCANVNLSSNFRIDLIGEYTINDHVTEFYYVDNGTISNSTIPINKTLYSLLTTDSTTFLFTFKDSSTIPLADAIVHVFRYYVDEARFYEVETAKTDDNGQTHVHLVEEDVIYMFMVDKNSVWIYNSSNYNAKCISTPCEIQLSASADISPDIPVSRGNSFTVSSDANARTVTLDFALDSPESIRFGVYKFDKGVTTLLSNETINTSIGSITLNVPSTYGNSTHFVAIFENGEHIKSEFVSFEESARETFGILGVILGALLVLTIILMSISEGALLVLFVVLAVLLIWLLKLFEMNWMTMASIIIVGAVIIFKLVARGKKQT